MTPEQRQLEHPRPHPARTIGYMLLSFVFRLLQFVLIVTGISVGVGTAVVWVGFPILLATTSFIRWSADRERGWAGRMLRVPLPPVERRAYDGEPVLRRWLIRLSDPTTWRDLAYLMAAFPLACVEFAIAIASIVLLPMAIWVTPWLGWLHGELAIALLGPNRTKRLEQKAERLQASRARGVDAAEAERRRIERDLHDGAQQRLVAVAMSLGRAKSKFDHDPEGVRELIDEAHADAKLAVSELRDLARGIYPAVLGDRGLDAALSAQAAKSPIPVDVTVNVEPRPPHGGGDDGVLHRRRDADEHREALRREGGRGEGVARRRARRRRDHRQRPRRRRDAARRRLGRSGRPRRDDRRRDHRRQPGRRTDRDPG